MTHPELEPLLESYVLWQRPEIAARPHAAAWCAAHRYTSGYSVHEAAQAHTVILVGAADYWPEIPLPAGTAVARAAPLATADPDDLEGAFAALLASQAELAPEHDPRAVADGLPPDGEQTL